MGGKRDSYISIEGGGKVSLKGKIMYHPSVRLGEGGGERNGGTFESNIEGGETTGKNFPN